MKWGVRKSRSSSGGAEGEGKASSDHKVASSLKNRIESGGVKNLSNEELQKLVTRMNLEQQHRNLTAKEPGKFSKGHQAIKEVLGAVKTANDIYNTGKAVNKTYKEIKGAVNSARGRSGGE
jgi:hypothetical protein